MDTEEEKFAIEWVEDVDGDVDDNNSNAAVDDFADLIEECDDDGMEEEYLVGEEIIPSSAADINTIPNSLDQIAAENLIYMAHDGNVEVMGDLIEEHVEQAENADYNEHQFFECQVTEEVITDDWVQQQGEERVEVPVDQLGGDQVDQDIDVPLPTIQDEYTASRPYPCDFCSRRFRKKANLMNHMIAHKNDRPHICNLCGARYIRRTDLLNHLKIHAQIPEHELDDLKAITLLKAQQQSVAATRKTTTTKKRRTVTTKTKAVPKEKKPTKTIKLKQEYFDDDDYEADDNYPSGPSKRNRSESPQVEQYPIIDPSRPFVCQKCGVSFAREKALMSHAKMHRNDAPYECDSCSEMFWDIYLLRDHQRTHHAGGQTSNSEYEPENEKDFSDSEPDSKYGEFYCNVCGMSFHRQDLLKRHMSKCRYGRSGTVSSPTQHCKCNVCGETFIEALDLLAHAEVHARDQPFKCMLCGETFVDEPTIKKHIATFHVIELTENTCRLCGKHCKDARSLMKHSWDHSRTKNHSCSKCCKTFHNKARLKRHMQSHRNKSVQCETCDKTFPDGRSYMNHRHSHNNVSGRQFPCKECNKTFGSRSSQQIHMRIHTGERPYGCRFCWKAFADGGTLRKHERIHTGEKPYACPVCPRAFNQRVVLREHIRSHHSGPDSLLGSLAAPYACSVCGDTFSLPAKLIQHLIEHSDTNTAMSRQPATGPRKYKRRRKLKPHELERLRSENVAKDSDTDDDEEMNGYGNDTQPTSGNGNNVMDREEFDDLFQPKIEKVTPEKLFDNKIKRRDGENITIDEENKTYTVFQNIENALQTYDSLVVGSSSNSNNDTTNKQIEENNAAMDTPQKQSQTTNRTGTTKKRGNNLTTSTASRPKMIYTEKTRVPIVDGKRKSKTLITRTTPKSTTSNTNQRAKRGGGAAANKTNARKLASASSSSYNTHNNDNMYNKNLDETNLLLELSQNKFKFDPDVVNDLEEILRSPIKSKDNSYSEDCAMETVTLTNQRTPTRTTTRTTAGNRHKKIDNSRTITLLSTNNNRRQSNRKPLAATQTLSYQQNSPIVPIPVQEIKEEMIDDLPEDEHITDEIEVYTCEMCSAVFRDRSQLLVHVPIHI